MAGINSLFPGFRPVGRTTFPGMPKEKLPKEMASGDASLAAPLRVSRAAYFSLDAMRGGVHGV